MEPYLRQPVFATSRANYAPAIQPQAAPWIASPLDIHEDPRIIAFTAEVIAQGITTSTWFAKRIAMATDHRLHAWATRHEADGSLAGIAPVVIAGAVGWEADPGSRTFPTWEASGPRPGRQHGTAPVAQRHRLGEHPEASANTRRRQRTWAKFADARSVTALPPRGRKRKNLPHACADARGSGAPPCQGDAYGVVASGRDHVA